MSQEEGLLKLGLVVPHDPCYEIGEGCDECVGGVTLNEERIDYSKATKLLVERAEGRVPLRHADVRDAVRVVVLEFIFGGSE